MSLNKSATFNPITTIPDFTIGFASPKKDTDNSLKKFNTISTDSYVNSAFEKPQIVRFKNEILQSLQGDIKKLLESRFKFFKSRCEDVVVKSNATLNSQIKHLQEELRSKDEIIKL